MTTRKQLDQEYHQRIVAENDELGAEIKRLTDENTEMKEVDTALRQVIREMEQELVMSDAKHYVIAIGDTYSKLKGKVNSYLEAGFELHGALIMQPEYGILYQPMIYTPPTDSDTGEAP